MPRVLLVALCTALFLAAAPAYAREGPAVLVAGPVPAPPGPALEDGLPAGEAFPENRLYARWDGRRLCLALNSPRIDVEGREFPDGGSMTCGEVPREDLREPLVIDLPVQDGTVAGAVRPEVAAVEYVGADGRPVRVATMPAPPRTAGTLAGGLRYVLGPAPASEPRTRRLLDAAGRVLHEEDLVPEGEDGRRVLGPRIVASGGNGPARWRVTAQVRSVLDPVPGAPSRRVRELCLNLHRAGGIVVVRGDDEEDAGGTEQCHHPSEQRSAVLVDGECSRLQPHIVLGLALPGDVPRHLVTGTGRRLPVRAIALPAAYGLGALRVVVGAGGGGEALRRVDGGRLAQDVGLAPPWLGGCGVADLVRHDRLPPDPPLGGDTVLWPAGDAGPRVFVRDSEDRLCLAVERAVRPLDCRAPSPWLGSVHVSRFSDGTHAAGAVDPRVAAVRVRLWNGTTLTVPTVAQPAYTGRYAGALRFFAATAPAGTRIRDVAPVAPGGTPTDGTWVSGPRVPGPFRREASVRIGGRPSLVVAAKDEDGDVCRFLVHGSRTPAADGECGYGVGWIPDSGLLIDVPCGRPGTVFVRGGRELTRLEVTLAGGRVLRAASKPPRNGGRIAFVVVPPTAEIRAVRTVVAAEKAVALRVARPASVKRQCGYRSYPSER